MCRLLGPYGAGGGFEAGLVVAGETEGNPCFRTRSGLFLLVVAADKNAGNQSEKDKETLRKEHAMLNPAILSKEMGKRLRIVYDIQQRHGKPRV